MTKTYSPYGEHTFVTIRYQGKDEELLRHKAFGNGVWPIVLHTGSRVWIAGDYSLEDKADIVRVSDGHGDGYDQHGGCVLSVPADWCNYHTDQEADMIEMMIDADKRLLSYAL